MSSLFTTRDLRPAAVPQERRGPTARRAATPPSTFAVAPARAHLAALIGELRPDQDIEYATAGKWSAHELLQYVLEQTGPADVRIATWTLTEEPCRVLHRLLAEGTIRTLKLVLDQRIKSRCPQAYQLATTLPNTTLHLVRSHAKATTIENAHWGVSVIGSQNYTRNPRIEVGIIRTSPASAAFHGAWIDAEIAGEEPFAQ